MKFSIITPSFRSLEWLKLCVASVADQQGAAFEHLVQDSCSDDGTPQWLAGEKRVKGFVEKDAGMYDAVNRGLRRASGEILAYLNCDEQYLPGALASVAELFEREPETDIVLADSVVVDPKGDFICCRKCVVPWHITLWVFNPTITSSIFFHRRVVEKFNLYFDARWRDLGDVFWMKEALELGLKIRVLRRYTSVFTDTGENMNLKPNAEKEKRLWVRFMPAWVRMFRWPLLRLHRLRAIGHRLYWEKPFSYSLYTKASPDKRTEIFVPKPTGIWWQRHPYARPLKPL